MADLTGYWGVSGDDYHGHYVNETRDSAIPVTHEHKGGRRVHDHANWDKPIYFTPLGIAILLEELDTKETS